MISEYFLSFLIDINSFSQLRCCTIQMSSLFRKRTHILLVECVKTYTIPYIIWRKYRSDSDSCLLPATPGDRNLFSPIFVLRFHYQQQITNWIKNAYVNTRKCARAYTPILFRLFYRTFGYHIKNTWYFWWDMFRMYIECIGDNNQSSSTFWSIQ